MDDIANFHSEVEGNPDAEAPLGDNIITLI
jgi:hypothetical protein